MYVLCAGALPRATEAFAMKLNRSTLIASGVFVAVVAYFAIRMTINAAARSAPPAERPTAAAAAEAPRVVVRMVSAQMRPAVLSLRGQTEAARTVVARAETSGVVVSAPVAEGALVRRGQALCALDAQARSARIAEAQALVKARELDAAGARQLFERGFRSEVQVAQAGASLDAARASLAQARIEMDKLVVRAPFDGVFNRRLAEIGDFLSPGSACGEVVELNPLLVVAQASERDAPRLAIGQRAQATLATGETITGSISFISRIADPATRTFRVEMRAPNPGGRSAAGVTADLAAPTGAAPAHKLPPSVLVLSESGDVGARVVGDDNVARFVALEVAEESPQGVWVRGLPDPARVIVVGAPFVADGQRVTPVPEQPPVRTTPVATPQAGARAG